MPTKKLRLRGPFGAFVFFILLGTLMAMANADALPAPTVPDGFGVNIHFTDPQPGEMDRFREAGFGFARMDFQWARIEKTRGVYDFSAYDRLFETLKLAGTRPLFILDYGNDIYEKGPPRSPEARAAFARFAGGAVRHFTGRGVVWEIWNEPNGDGFWPPHSNAKEYATLAVETAKAIRVATRNVRLLRLERPAFRGNIWRQSSNPACSGTLTAFPFTRIAALRRNPPPQISRVFAA